MGEVSRLNRHFNFFFLPRPAGQGASGLQEEQQGGEQGRGCVAGGSDTHRHCTRPANCFLWRFQKTDSETTARFLRPHPADLLATALQLLASVLLLSASVLLLSASVLLQLASVLLPLAISR